MRGDGRRKIPWFLLAALLIAGLTAYTRLPAPWRMSATNDEMLHLESFRNHYRTDDIYPLFLIKLERSGLLAGERLEQFKRLYHGSTLFQRGLCVLVDLHPPAFPVMAEIIEAVTDSSLTAFRLPSVVGSILAVFFLFKLGESLRDRSLGLWLAALQSIGFMSQTYAGIARPYVLAQAAVFLALWMFVRSRRLEHASPWRLWIAALVAQSLNWIVWSIMGPLVVIDLVRRFRAGTGLGRLVRQTWWYALLSALLLPILVVQLKNPATASNLVERPLYILWYHFCLASPFAAIDSAVSLEALSVISPAGIILLLAVLAGIAAVVADPEFLRGSGGTGLSFASVRIALVVCLIASGLTAIFGASGTRIALIYIMIPLVFAGVGLHWLLRTERASQIAVTIVVATFTVLRVGWPEDPYIRAFWSQTDYAPIAQRIAAELGPEDEWCAFPRQMADCLYRYAELPEPVLMIEERDFTRYVGKLPRRDGATLLFVKTRHAEGYGVLRRAPERWEYFNGFTVVKIPPR